MPPRPFWKGYLKFSLVSCPVAMSPAVSERDKLRFHTLNAATGNRIRSRYVDAVTGQPVAEDDQVKGYAVAEDRRVVLEEEELEAVALDSARTIDIRTFVPRDSIGWIWLDRPHHLVPDDAAGVEAFSVIREAMAKSGVAGISRTVLYRRERALMLVPCGKGLVVWTLRYGDEVRAPSAYFGALPAASPDTKLLALVTKLIDARTRPWDPELTQDPVQDDLLRLIEAKRKKPAGRKAKAAAPEQEPAGNVVSILDALRRSVDSETKGRR